MASPSLPRFIARWQRSTLTERSAAQSHFIELCGLLGQQTPIETHLKDRTLTNLYNQRPTWLAQAHERLDRAVLDAYGWPCDLGDEEILERLLGLNLERAAGAGFQESGR